MSYHCGRGFITAVSILTDTQPPPTRHADHIHIRLTDRKIHRDICHTPPTTHDDVIKWKHFPRHCFLAGNLPVTGEFSSQRPVTRSFDVFLDLYLNKRLNKQSRRRWFETSLSSLWPHPYVYHPPHSYHQPHAQLGTPPTNTALTRHNTPTRSSTHLTTYSNTPRPCHHHRTPPTSCLTSR